VRLQVAAASRKIFSADDCLALLLDVQAASEGDPLIPRIVWRNLEPLLETRGSQLASWHGPAGARLGSTAMEPLLGRIAERLMARRDKDLSGLISVVEALFATSEKPPRGAGACLDVIAKALSNGELSAEAISKMRQGLARPVAAALARGEGEALYFSALTAAAAWQDPKALQDARRLLLDSRAAPEKRSRALSAVLASRDAVAIESAAAILKAPAGASEDLLREVLAGLGRLDAPSVATSVLDSIDGLPAGIKTQAIDLLAQRPSWASALLAAVESKKLDSTAVTLNQLRRILAIKDEALTKRVTAVWGAVRAERNPEREKVIGKMRKLLDDQPGNPWNGKAVFEKTCMKCHTIFGKGANVGPDITVNGRETLDAVLSNLLDPNLVIGKGYQAWVLLTKSGRALTGLLTEESPQRVVLKVEGGKEEVIPRDDIASLELSEVSMMPEDLEKTLKEDEFRDLIAFLRYEEAPPDPVATVKDGKIPDGERSISVSQDYGLVSVFARLSKASPPVPILRLQHSNDQRSFIHPLLAPNGRTVLTALRPDDHPWQYGIFTGHAKVNEVDFWHEKGWIRSRGVESVRALDDRVEIVAKNDWLTQRRGGKRILEEKQRIVVHAPDAKAGAYRIDFDWQLTPDEDVTVGPYEYGGLAFRPAAHSDRRNEHAEGERGWAWQDMTGKFGEGDKAVTAGVAILDHPKNLGFPNAWRVDGQGLINPAITARGPLSLAKGKTAVFKYRLVVHDGPGDRRSLDEELKKWVAEAP
jgi:putative heme-binding domain-containing protein